VKLPFLIVLMVLALATSASAAEGGEGEETAELGEQYAGRTYHRRPTRSRMSVVSSRVAPMRDKITSHGPLVTSSG
jgi:hypothetical protein